ncbi:MAG: sigma-54 dependent transcriptional regulator [Rhodothermales bacterium]|nr:sigma-54 dependent transcriptional regulator [Rhodothermales bacterium]
MVDGRSHRLRTGLRALEGSLIEQNVAKKRIYIVDDEPKIGELFVNVLNRAGFDAQAFVSPQAMLERVERNEVPDVILTDLMMPEMTGIELIHALADRDKPVPVIIMTAHSSIQSAVDAMRLGAFHYLQKPVNLEEMRTLIGKALELYDVPVETPARRGGAAKKAVSDEALIGESPAIQKIRQLVQTLRNVPNTTVLIRGETGTGKNLVAKVIHDTSVYNAGRFVEINCAALPDNLLEAELFGYERGAFTDARDSKQGLLEVADGGTLFLDEIDSMSLALQAKLLSFLESRVFRRLGGVDEIKVTIRLICATNGRLEEQIAARKFRSDLFYRINVINLRLPPLRTMGDDLLAIARRLLAQFALDMGRPLEGFTADAEAKLSRHSWPGNVRELRNVLERAAIFAPGARVTAADLVIDPVPVEAFNESADVFRFPSGGPLEELERSYIRHILGGSQASYAEVARVLGISKKTLWEKRKRYELDAPAGVVEDEEEG